MLALLLSAVLLATGVTPAPNGLMPLDDDSSPSHFGPVEAAFVYSHFTKEAIPWNELVKRDERVTTAPNEFERRSRAAAVQDELQQQLSQLSPTRKFLVLVETRLAEYDFDKHGFPTSLGDHSAIRFALRAGEPSTNRYAIRFTNGSAFAYLRLPDDKAAATVKQLPSDREVTLELEVVPFAARKVATVLYPLHIIDARIVRLRAVTSRGLVLGEGASAAQPREPTGTLRRR